MSKHPLDHAKPATGQRTARFVESEKATTPSAATRSLQQRPRTQGDGKLREFTRIERSDTD